MNKKLFLFEIKSQFKNVAVFTAISCAVMAMFLLGMYPVFLNAKSDILPLFEQFPEAFLNAFGMSAESFFSYIGVYSFAYIYAGIIGAAMGLITGLSIFARETRNKCVDFLLTKPVNRRTVFFSKLAAAAALILAAGIALLLFAMLLYAFGGEGSFGIYVLIVATSIITDFVFLAIGVFLGVFLKRVKSVAAIAAGGAVLAFILSALQGIVNIDALKIISPLQYFSPAYIAANNSIQAWTAIIATLVILGSSVASYFIFMKKEF